LNIIVGNLIKYMCYENVISFNVNFHNLANLFVKVAHNSFLFT